MKEELGILSWRTVAEAWAAIVIFAAGAICTSAGISKSLGDDCEIRHFTKTFDDRVFDCSLRSAPAAVQK